MPFNAGNIFSNEPAIALAAVIADITPGDLNWVHFTSGGSEAVEVALKMARQYHVERGEPRTRQGHRPLDDLPRGDAGRAVRGRRRGPAGQVPADAPRHAPHPADLLLSLPVGPHVPDVPGHLRRRAGARDPAGRAGARRRRSSRSRSWRRSAARSSRSRSTSRRSARSAIATACCSSSTRSSPGFGRTGTQLRHRALRRRARPDGHGQGHQQRLRATCGRGGARSRPPGIRRFEDGLRAHLHVRRQPRGHGRRPRRPRHLPARAPRRARRRAGAGRSVLQGLREFPFVGDVRTIGFMAGIEFVADPATRAPFPPALKVAVKVREAGLRNGIVTYPGTGMADGKSGDIISLYPPLTFSLDDIADMGERLRRRSPTWRRSCRPDDACPNPSRPADPVDGPLGDHAAGRVRRRNRLSQPLRHPLLEAARGRSRGPAARAGRRCRRRLDRSAGPRPQDAGPAARAWARR